MNLCCLDYWYDFLLLHFSHDERPSVRVHIESICKWNWSMKRLWKSFSVDDFPTMRMHEIKKVKCRRVGESARSLENSLSSAWEENKAMRNINNRSIVFHFFRFCSPFCERSGIRLLEKGEHKSRSHIFSFCGFRTFPSSTPTAFSSVFCCVCRLEF